jgi:hypothetical protein
MTLLAVVLLASGAVGQGIRSVAPNGAGLSSQRLDRIGAVMNEHVAKGHSRRDRADRAARQVGYFETYGFRTKRPV